MSGSGSTPYVGEVGRRPWYRLEGRHSGLLAGRLAAAVVVAAGALLLPHDMPVRDDNAVVLACVVAVVAQLLLWLVPRRNPRALGGAVWASIVVDVAWATAVAAAGTGAEGPLTGLLLITALWAAVGYSAVAGLCSGVLASCGFLWLVTRDGLEPLSAPSVSRLVFFWATLGFAVLGTAAGERDLRVRAERMEVLHNAGRELLAAPGASEIVRVAQQAAGRLMPDWGVRLRPGSAPPQVLLQRAGLDGVVVVPVAIAGRDFGVIECRRPLMAGLARHGARARDISALEMLAAALASALARADLVATMRRQSLTDVLTGLGNRRAFDLELDRRIAEARRSGRPLSLCLIDIDRFKAYNDSFGHQAGDEALAAVAAVLRTSCRAADIPARYGGEEMVVILPGTPMAGALDVAERIRRAVEAGPMPLRQVTVSVGVTTTNGDCSAELLVEAADRALYEAKEGGRNRVCAGLPESPMV